MGSVLRGWKIRNARLSAGLSQAELARRTGLSAPYLNLIERNKRRATAAILARIAEALDVDRSELDGDAERRLSEEIGEIVVDPILGQTPMTAGSAEELVGRDPGWAELIRRLYRAYQDQRQSVLALADRLNHDPFLGESVHRVLNHVTSIRSSAEILAGPAPLDPADRDRFLSIVTSDSAKLSDAARSLLAFFDDTGIRVRSATTMEHVDAFIFETNNYFGSLEMAAAEIRAGFRPGETPLAAAERDRAVATDGAIWNPASRGFQAVRSMVAPGVEGEIGRIVSSHPALPSPESRDLARSALTSYATAAVLMPYEDFLGAARACRYDLDRLSARYGVSYEQAAHRLATLRKPGAEGVRFAYMRSDPSGFVTKRLPLSGLPLPRYGTACPLWVIYGAFQSPGATVRSFGELPGGEQFLFFARAVEKSPAVIGRPRHLLSIMLACSAADAAQVVYGDGLDRKTAMVPVGTICRLCARLECGARQEAPLIA
ncbi:helix-turn-helix domain-containing protein [Aquibium microcysteis]|uniref:helix-turn-helix domain-containing protein n=1 Tax=Aquibium microcysteis TaxID=675281 RepID=UPI00165CF526|nr:helix-turn-helix transcriptional regulator [Aquibium microcysteis]